MIWSQWHNKLFLKQHLDISLVEQKILSLLRENIRAFNHKLIVPHTLCGVENPSTEIEFAGEKLSSPIIMAPVAAHKLANEQGEVATARGVHEFGSLYTTSSYSTVDLPEITEALQGTPHLVPNFTLVRMTVSTATSWTV